MDASGASGAHVDAVTRRRFLQLLGIGGAGAVLAACGSGGSSPPAGGSGGGSGALPTFPLGAAKNASGTVEITMWHAMTNNNLKTINSLTKKFNASQSKVKVTLLNQQSYADTMTAYTAGLGSGNLPDMAQIESILLQQMIDSQGIVPVAAALKADSSFDNSDVLPSATSYFTVNGVQYGMPWNCSSQVLFFNQKTFKSAGLDPAKPPSTFAEYHSMAEQAQKKGGIPFGTAIKLAASNVEDWIAQAGQVFLNKDNGRSGRATAVEFGGGTGLQIFSFMEQMLSTKIAEGTLNTNFDNLLAIGNGKTAMTVDTSAALGTVLQLLGGGQYHNVTLGVGPLPGLNGPGNGVPYGGAGLYILKHSSPEKQDASWEFIKYLLSPDAMATWAIGSGYIPITKSSIQTAAIKRAWRDTPQYKVAYEQVANSTSGLPTAGGVTGAFAQIETNLDNALSLVSNGTSAATALAQAVSTSNQAIASYNSRVGG